MLADIGDSPSGFLSGFLSGFFAEGDAEAPPARKQVLGLACKKDPRTVVLFAP